jgi:hypothetical protein
MALHSVQGPGIIANDPGGLACMIQDLIGEDGFQIVEQMMVRGGGSTEAILELGLTVVLPSL